MTSSAGISTFADSVEALLAKVECRQIFAAAERLDAYRLRYNGYLREGAITPNESGLITDSFDCAPNSLLFGVYMDGRLASTIRLGIASRHDGDSPATTTFADCLQPLIDDGRTLIDPTRFVLSEEHARAHPKLPYVTLRIAWVVADHLGVDHVLASVRTEHQAFYRRFFGHKLVCPARPYPSLIKPLSLMILDCREARERGLRRYPFLDSTREERNALLGDLVPA